MTCAIGRPDDRSEHGAVWKQTKRRRKVSSSPGHVQRDQTLQLPEVGRHQHFKCQAGLDRSDSTCEREDPSGRAGGREREARSVSVTKAISPARTGVQILMHHAEHRRAHAVHFDLVVAATRSRRPQRTEQRAKELTARRQDGLRSARASERRVCARIRSTRPRHTLCI